MAKIKSWLTCESVFTGDMGILELTFNDKKYWYVCNFKRVRENIVLLNYPLYMK